MKNILLISSVKDTLGHLSGLHAFRINGTVHHRMGTLFPPGELPPMCAQLYVLDSHAMRDSQLNMPFAKCFDEAVLADLDAMLRTHNAFVRAFQSAASLGDPEVQVVIRAAHVRTMNRPTAPEIAVFVPEARCQREAANPRDIVVRLHGGGLRHISEFNAAFDPLHFVLLYPRGESGWSLGIKKRRRSSTEDDLILASAVAVGSEPAVLEGEENARFVSVREYMAFHCMERVGKTNFWLRCTTLFEEWLCVQFAKVEQFRLRWYRDNQTKIRADLFRGVSDALASGDGDMSRLGRRVVLGSQFIGGPRHLQQLYQGHIFINFLWLLSTVLHYFLY